MNTTKIKLLIILLVSQCIVAYFSYSYGYNKGKASVDCQPVAETFFQERKKTFELKFCEMPPLDIQQKEHLTSEDN